MVVKSSTLVKTDGWEIKHITKESNTNDSVSEYYVMSYQPENEGVSFSFTHVTAGGGIIVFHRCETLDEESPRSNGHRTGSITDALTGINTLDDESDMPEEIYQKLKDIGPW